jgi:hypothetical protein
VADPTFPQQIAIFRESRYSWRDPWSVETDEPVLQLVKVYDATRLRRSTITWHDGYESRTAPRLYLARYKAYVVRYDNYIDFTGGSQWSWRDENNQKLEISLVVHDKNTVQRQRRRLISSDGKPMSFNPLSS